MLSIVKKLRNLRPVDVYAESLPGWFSRADMRSYRQLAGMVRLGVMVEVGAYRGRSICSIRDVCRENDTDIIAVDAWIEVDGLSEFKKNVGDSPGIIPWHIDSWTAADMLGSLCGCNSIDAVFIDAAHDYNSVAADIDMWLPLVRSGGWIGGHDYCKGYPGVIRAVKEAFGGKHKTMDDSIWYYQKP